MKIKETIVEIAQEMGFARTVIGSLAPMEKEREHYLSWLAKGHAADMDYLKRDPNFRTSPQLLHPNCRSAIIVSVSYYTEPPQDPGLGFGRVASYAVGLDYHAVIRARLRELKARIEATIGRPLIGKAFTDDVALYEQGYASRHGLGFSGKNTMIIGPKLSGSFYFLGELFCDLDLEPDQPYVGTCGNCFRCAEACPTKAIEEPLTVNANLCISYLTIENKGEIPLALRPKLGRWLFGCDICQIVCPYNQRPPETPWVEFAPQSGSGHYIDLLKLLQIDDETVFRRHYGSTPLRRPRRRGLLRNALVVLGNSLADASDTTFAGRAKIAESIFQFANCGKEESMLMEHAAWALAQNPEFKPLLMRLLNNSEDSDLKNKASAYA